MLTDNYIPANIQLRDYQQKLVRDALDALTRHRAVMVQGVTGCGKTVCFLEIFRRCLNKGYGAMMVAHRQELIFQCRDKLYNGYGVIPGIIMSGYKPMYHLPIQVASVQTLVRREKPKNIKLIICDEAHHCTARSYRNILEAYPDAKVLGFTATPIRTSGEGFDDIFGELVQGPGVKWFEENGYLCPAQVFINPIDHHQLASVGITAGDYNEGQLSKFMSTPQRIRDVVQNYKLRAFGKRNCVFGVDIAHSKQLAAAFNQDPDLSGAGIKAVHVDGTTETGLRQRMFSDFAKGTVKVLCNVGIATEGVDIPAIECVQAARPTKALWMFLQMCLDLQTEILTKDGWKNFSQVNNGDHVYSFDLETNSIVDDKVIEYIKRSKYKGERMAKIKGQLVDINVSEHHDLLVKNRKHNTYVKQTAIDTAESRSDFFNIPASSNCSDAENAEISDSELELIGWFMSDGSIKNQRQSLSISQSQAQPYYLHKSIMDCLTNSGLKFGTYLAKRTGKYEEYAANVFYVVSKGKPKGTKKHLSGWGHLEKWIDKSIPDSLFTLSKRQFGIVLKTWNYGDGKKSPTKGYERRTHCIALGTSKELADRFQMLCILKGYRCAIAVRGYNKSPLYEAMVSDRQTLTISGHNIKGSRTRIEIENQPETNELWCVRTGNGTIVTRRNGKVAIMGNCGRGSRLSPGKDRYILLDHANWVAEHGRPNAERKWTLKGKKKTGNATKVRQFALRFPDGSVRMMSTPEMSDLSNLGTGVELVEVTENYRVNEFETKMRVATSKSFNKYWAFCKWLETLDEDEPPSMMELGYVRNRLGYRPGWEQAMQEKLARAAIESGSFKAVLTQRQNQPV